MPFFPMFTFAERNVGVADADRHGGRPAGDGLPGSNRLLDGFAATALEPLRR